MTVISINVPKIMEDEIKALIKRGYYDNKSEIFFMKVFYFVRGKIHGLVRIITLSAKGRTGWFDKDWR